MSRAEPVNVVGALINILNPAPPLLVRFENSGFAIIPQRSTPQKQAPGGYLLCSYFASDTVFALVEKNPSSCMLDRTFLYIFFLTSGITEKFLNGNTKIIGSH